MTAQVVEIKKTTATDEAIAVLEFLNAKTGRKYPSKNPRGNPTTNLEIILHRLKEGYTAQDCKSVIAAKCREWLHDEKMSKYLRPETLFCRAHFETYLGEIGGAE